MMRKSAHLAYWLLPSFYTIEFTNIGIIKGMFIGVHKPRNLKKVLSTEGNINLEDLKPKADLAVLDRNLESIPFPAENLIKIVACLSALHPTEDFFNDCRVNAHIMHEKIKNTFKLNYFVRDFQQFKENNLINESRKIAKYYFTDPLTRPNDIRWIKGSLIHHIRTIIDESTSEVKNSISQAIIIGIDTRYNNQLIGFKKSWNNFTTIIPLIDKSEQFMTSILYTIYHRPRTYMITPNLLESELPNYNRKFKNYETSTFDLRRISFEKLILELSE